MRATYCPHCGAGGLAGTTHALDDGRSFTQYYCGCCAKAWVERVGEAQSADQPQRTALGAEVAWWVERYIPAFPRVNLPFMRQWSRATFGAHDNTAPSQANAAEQHRVADYEHDVAGPHSR